MKLLWFIGAPHVMQSVSNTIEQGHEVEVILPTWLIAPADIDLDNVTVHRCSNDIDCLLALDQVLSQGNIDYFVPSFPDHLTTQVADICSKHSIVYVNRFSAPVFSSKRKYYHVWKTLSIPTPEIYLDIQSAVFPCVIKPCAGIGGKGIKILQNAIDIDENVNNDTYLLQEYVHGDVVSIMGLVVNGNVEIDLIYDIETDALPCVAETGLYTPSKHADIISQVIPYLNRFFKFTQFNNMPFMLDVIVDANKKIYFLDFGARLSVNGQILIHHAGEKNYVTKVLTRLQGTQSKLNLGQAVLFRHLGLAQGNVREIFCSQPELAAELKLPRQISEILHDDCVYSNGYAIITGLSRVEIEDNFRRCVDSISVTYIQT